ncbi:arf-GAP with GTPase, ANK repeat and PH domain-containing protein 1-like isoform X2 [Corythoichthys intestinalis]|uniref:arf-GAP with GTPase, ANK repeat and PH domain-containing protein 1-like isoform X2 n=1 Tax=Corythoichthys intestinalis TaxID=161448 RepID=UPI0025A55414|nr:arf-GAP with GTPase, ANK repeat and PH domain-containing protein 1-like isoform X2 [Corythoichthys intestinalis]
MKLIGETASLPVSPSDSSASRYSDSVSSSRPRLGFRSFTACQPKPDPMSDGGALQQRTTYLISLTLVKVEAVEENAGEIQRSTPGREERKVGTGESELQPLEAPLQSSKVKDETLCIPSQPERDTSPKSLDPDLREPEIEEENAWEVQRSTLGREESKVGTGETSLQLLETPDQSNKVKDGGSTLKDEPPSILFQPETSTSPKSVDPDLRKPEIEKENEWEVQRSTPGREESKVGTGETSLQPLEAPVQSSEVKDGGRTLKDRPLCISFQPERTTSPKSVDPDFRKLEIEEENAWEVQGRDECKVGIGETSVQPLEAKAPVQSNEVKDGAPTLKDGPPWIHFQPERATSPKSVDPETIRSAPETKQSWPTETLEPVRTPTRTSLPIRPVSLLKSHGCTSARGRDSREARERSPASAQSLDRKDSRVPSRSPGPCRASWAEAGGTDLWRDARDEVPAAAPRKDRLKSGSGSLPVPASRASKAPRKGKSRTLDNSDLKSLSQDLALSKEAQQGQRGASKDRKMLKFISGIFTKSNSGPSPSPLFIQRDSSEEEVNIANSQEWSLGRSVPELRLGILGSLKSGKSALVTKYITGSYVALEKPDGGRYKKEVLVDGQSYLLLIREEAGAPDEQFCGWVDAVLLVFSLENEESFQELYRLYGQLSSQRADVPVIVVGTQDKISSGNPRVIDDKRARQLCMDVRHSLFYETCATYGFNVDRVFSEAAQKMVAQKKQTGLQACKSLPNSPSHSGGSTPGSASFPGQVSNGVGGGYACSLPSTPVLSHRELRVAHGEGGARSLKSVPRRPSLFKNRDPDRKGADAKGDSGATRAVPIKQSILWKRSGSSLNKEWKKKYVTLSKNGTLCYHSSSSDYMQNVHGKEIDLLRVTVKVPGKRPPRAVAPAGPSPVPPASSGVNGLAKEMPSSDGSSTVPQLCPSTLSVLDDRSTTVGERGLQRCPSSLSTKAQSVDALEGTSGPFSGKDAGQSSPMSDRKKNKRKKSMNQKGDAAATAVAVGQAEDEENADFIIVSFTGQTWHFEAPSLEERDSWVAAIESQILASLQSCESSRNKARRSSQSEAVALQAIRNTKGNNLCVDCQAPNPTWASLNLGALICIECSGIHRNLGTHLSRVRSLDLDDWPGELTRVLAAIGNHTANGVWEARTLGRPKPAPNASREERESWIRAKYEQRAFVPPLRPPADDDMASRLLSAVNERDLPGLLLLLAHSSKELVNARPPPTGTALHAACQLGDAVMAQLLIWYGIDAKARDHQGRTAMMMAKKSGSKGCVDILLQHGCCDETSPAATTPVLARRSSGAGKHGP